MLLLPILHTLYDYNYWARDQQLKACAALTEEQFLRPMGSSYSSVRDTLAHMVGAEWIWRERWNGRSPARDEAKAFTAETFPTLAAVEQRWREGERETRSFLARVNSERLLEPLTYLNLAGERWTYPLWQTLLHVVNHQTYHRGQVTTLLRQLGAKPAGLDLLVAIDAGQVK